MVSRRRASTDTPTEELTAATSVALNGFAQPDPASEHGNGVVRFEVLSGGEPDGAEGAPPRRTRTRARTTRALEATESTQPSDADIVQAMLRPVTPDSAPSGDPAPAAQVKVNGAIVC